VNSLKGTNDRLAVAITKAEFAVLRTACSVSSLLFGSYVCFLFGLHGNDLLLFLGLANCQIEFTVCWKWVGQHNVLFWNGLTDGSLHIIKYVLCGYWISNAVWAAFIYLFDCTKINVMGQSSLQKVWTENELFWSNLLLKLLNFFFALLYCVYTSSLVRVLLCCMWLSYSFIFKVVILTPLFCISSMCCLTLWAGTRLLSLSFKQHQSLWELIGHTLILSGQGEGIIC
jgi:hypothetical protein